MKGVEVPRKRHYPEQILRKLREIEVALAKGETVARAVRQIAVTEQTYYRWRNEYGALSIDQGRRLKQPEQENARPKRAVTDLALDKLTTRSLGYRRIIALLRDRGWHVNHKRVERIWRREGLKVPKKQPKRGRL